MLLFASLVVLFCCCSNNEGGTPSLPVDLDIRVGANVRSGMDNGSAAERVIERIRVMVFYKSSGLLDVQGYDEHPGGFTIVPVQLNLTVQSGEKIFCVIANEPPVLKGTLDGIKKLNEVTALSMQDEHTYNIPGALLPMTLKKQELILPGRDAGDPVELPVARALGKVRMKIIKDAGNPHQVALNSVKVIRTPRLSRILEGNAVSPTAANLSDDLPAQTTFLPDNEVTALSPLKPDSLYLYEHYWGLGAEESAAGSATSVEVKITMKSELQTYRIPLIGAYQNGYDVYAVVRNTIADLTVTVFPDGLRISYEVMPWATVDHEKAPGEEDSPVSVTQWITPAEYEHELE